MHVSRDRQVSPFPFNFFFGDMRGEGGLCYDRSCTEDKWMGGVVGGPLPRFALAGSRAVVDVCLLDGGGKYLHSKTR